MCVFLLFGCVWFRIQDSLRTKLITEDNLNFKWKATKKNEGEAEEDCQEALKYVGGVDLSFSKDDTSLACGTLVVLDFNNLNVVYEDCSVIKLDVPYVPGFLAFREVSSAHLLSNCDDLCFVTGVSHFRVKIQKSILGTKCWSYYKRGSDKIME